jgi:hypothetical protein
MFPIYDEDILNCGAEKHLEWFYVPLLSSFSPLCTSATADLSYQLHPYIGYNETHITGFCFSFSLFVMVWTSAPR